MSQGTCPLDSHFDPSATISGEEMNRRFGVTESDQKGFDAVEIEWTGILNTC